MPTASRDTFEPTAPGRRRRRTAALPFVVVVDRHGPPLLRFCISRPGPDRGEDAFQETLLAALCHYDELKDPAAVGGWLFAIAQRRIVDVARSRPHESALGDELEEHAAAALPSKQREAIGLRFLGDRSHADVARMMGTTAEAAAAQRLRGTQATEEGSCGCPGRSLTP